MGLLRLIGSPFRLTSSYKLADILAASISLQEFEKEEQALPALPFSALELFAAFTRFLLHA